VVGLVAVAMVGLGVPGEPSPVQALDNTPWTTPTVPANCTTAQANAGTVAGCLLPAANTAPENVGWPTPPYPATVAGQPFPPPGWTWNGYTYNGSPALAAWETLFAANTTPIGSIPAGQLKAHPVALRLFEGFMREVQAQGYHFRNGYSYSFRCTTSSTANCYNLPRTKLSNHAYGLGADLNSDRNPVRTYYGINGATACATPMVTDIPRWVVQTAEKWGLYWGGYGWSSGCSSPSQVKTSASRDPTHFEFRGTYEQAWAVWRANTNPTLCVDTVTDAGTAQQRCLRNGELLPAGTRAVVNTGAPAGTSSALVNITTLAAAANGVVTVESCAARPAGARPTVNSVVSNTRTAGNLAIAPLDSTGRFCVHLGVATQLIVDVQGFFAPSAANPNGLAYTPSAAGRLINTRTQPYCTPTATCAPGPVPQWAEVQLVAPGAPPDTQASLVTLVEVDVPSRGYLTANRCDTLVPGPQATSNLNATPGLAVSNLGVVASTSNGGSATLCTTASLNGHLIVDSQGFFSPPSNGGWTLDAVAAQRVIDTTGCRTDPVTDVSTCGLPLGGGEVMRLRAPAGATAVVINLLATGSYVSGYLTALPCAEMAPGPQAVATTNYAAYLSTTNLAVVRTDADGLVCVYASSAVHVAVDLQATLSPTGATSFSPVAPTRRLDTRAP
jgi:hypothetical protein